MSEIKHRWKLWTEWCFWQKVLFFIVILLICPLSYFLGGIAALGRIAESAEDSLCCMTREWFNKR